MAAQLPNFPGIGLVTRSAYKREDGLIVVEETFDMEHEFCPFIGREGERLTGFRTFRKMMSPEEFQSKFGEYEVA